MQQYYEQGYLEIPDVFPEERLSKIQQSYDCTVREALKLDLPENDPETGWLKKHHVRNIHRPGVAQAPMMEALCAPKLMDFSRRLIGPAVAFHGATLFAMRENYNYPGAWHRDSYGAWGKDSEKEIARRTLPVWPVSQILVAIEDDECLWFVPRSHNRVNTPAEEHRFENTLTGSAEMLDGAIQFRVPAGSAVAFDPRGIHRGLKPAGRTRRALFFINGSVAEVPDSKLTRGWAGNPAYADPGYLATLPQPLREAIGRTVEAYAGIA